MYDDYFYVFCRTDLSLADQACQIAHVCADAGRYFGIHERCNLVLLQVKNQAELFKIDKKLKTLQIQHTMQVEHDDERGTTALATEMVSGDARRVFRKYRLWTGERVLDEVA